MEDRAFSPNTTLGALPDDVMDFDFMDELLYNGCWLETTDGSNFGQLGVSSASNLSSQYFPSSETNTYNLNQRGFQEVIERSNTDDNPPVTYPQMEVIPTAAYPSQSESFVLEGTEMSRRLWIGPSGNQNPSTTVKNRLTQAIECLKESISKGDVLIQMWVPIKKGGKQILITDDQPFSFSPNSKSLADYRNISKGYQFAAEKDSKDGVGLPGRVFLKKEPEWTPDVRFFKREEYPRVNYAQMYSVSGSVALPVFERGSGTCLGVVEIVTTTENVNYRPELENICKALEAVDLRSSEISGPHKVMECNEFHRVALAEIQEVLKSVCDAHNLPLAQTWAPCTQQCKVGCHHPDKKDAVCISIVDSAYYVPQPLLFGFHEACSEHHLLRGEGVVGRAFMTNQLCFDHDITTFSKAEYSLSHHARVLKLRGAAALRLRSNYTGSTDFILEFFLPLNCKDSEEQNQMLGSLSSLIQQVCRSLRVVTDQELAEETAILERQKFTYSSGNPNGQNKGKSEYSPSKQKKIENDITKGNGADAGDFSFSRGHHHSGTRKTGEKSRAKTERSISLQELRQYFSGSLKDAAKSIGVCPTTLKRICRQHGITRWPSRKIKKVGHSLRKLQLVIDSVQGAEGAIQLSSFYTNFPELSSPSLPGTSHFPPTNRNADHLKQLNNILPEGGLFSPATTASKSTSSSCSHSSSSSLCCSTGAKQLPATIDALGSRDALATEQPEGNLTRAGSDTELHKLGQDEKKFFVRSHSHKILSEHHSIETKSPLVKSKNSCSFRAKATFGGENIRFSMPQQWGFGDLQGEVARRFSIDDISKMDLKYLDDDSEWILLTCDADLEECVDIHRSSKSRTIKLSLHQALRPNLGSSLGSCGPLQ